MTDPRIPDDPFDAIAAEVLAHADRFGHRQHLHATWLAVRRYGVATAVEVISEGIRRTARRNGALHKYHATVSRAWVTLVGHALGDRPAGEETFDAFLARCPHLLDRRLLGRHYRPATLATDQARSGWVEPDLDPLPEVGNPA